MTGPRTALERVRAYVSDRAARIGDPISTDLALLVALASSVERRIDACRRAEWADDVPDNIMAAYRALTTPQEDRSDG